MHQSQPGDRNRLRRQTRWLWLWQAIVASAALEQAEARPAFYKAKLSACRYFFGYVLPSAITGFSLVETLDETFLAFTLEQIEAA